MSHFFAGRRGGSSISVYSRRSKNNKYLHAVLQPNYLWKEEGEDSERTVEKEKGKRVDFT